MLDSWAAIHIAAYMAVVVLPAPPLLALGNSLWRHVVSHEGGSHSRARHLHRALPPFLMGLVERPLYLAALLSGNAEFIGVWLALKVAGGWNGWTEGMKVPAAAALSPDTVTVPGRVLFTTSLLSGGLSAAHALGTATAVTFALTGDHARAIFVVFGPFALTSIVALAAYVWPTPRK